MSLAGFIRQKMPASHNERLLSLDLFRGITMLLLIAEGTNLYYFLNVAAPENSIFSILAAQFYHAQWRGMHFWDLIQPYFTFIIGVAMAFSLKKRLDQGINWFKIFRHIFFRCSVLFFLGIMLQIIYREKPVWELWNILTQLSISIFIAFLIFRASYSTQLIVSFCLLIVTELSYRYISIDGFDLPFVKDHNLGTFIDLFLMGKTHPDGWVAVNFLPTTAHVIWGVLTGRVIMNSDNPTKRIRIISIAGLAAIIVGYGMDLTGITPINKHISTSAFVIASGGWCLLSFILLYWLVDVKGHRKWITFFAVVGMNSIFIYVFSRTIGRIYLNKFVPVVIKGFMCRFGVTEGIMNFTAYLAIVGIEWYLCYWLYKKKIFIKI